MVKPMIRKTVLQLGTIALLALMAWNAYLALSRFNERGRIADLSVQSSRMQAAIATVLRDITDMETGQRGYLLTATSDYLLPYSDAKARIATDFAGLRAALAKSPQSEQAIESKLESLANSKMAEMEHTINLRQQGYRHRAFKLVDSNEGLEYMDQMRGLLLSLSKTENDRFAGLQAEKNDRLRKAFREILVTNLSLFALAICLFAGLRYHGRQLEGEAVQSRQELIVRDVQLRKFTAALSTQARAKTSTIEQNAYLLLEYYADFLPRQGQQYAEQIKEASTQMERLRQDLIADGPAGADPVAHYESVA
jgi:CHASE3 domain sensor protein